MANLATDPQHRPDVLRLAFDIASTQTNQVGPDAGLADAVGPAADQRRHRWPGWTTRRWPATTWPPWTPPTAALMPGMATEAELASCAALSGTDFDVSSCS